MLNSSLMSLKKNFRSTLPHTLVFTSAPGCIQATTEELWWENEWSMNTMMLILWCIIKKSTCWSDAWPSVLQRWQVTEKCLHPTGGVLFKSGWWTRFSERHVRYTCIWVPHNPLGDRSHSKNTKEGPNNPRADRDIREDDMLEAKLVYIPHGV